MNNTDKTLVYIHVIHSLHTQQSKSRQDLLGQNSYLKKSRFMVFKPSQKRKRKDIQLLINDYKLDHAKETIFLGVILDENLH